MDEFLNDIFPDDDTPPSHSSHLDRLNLEQREAVETLDGPVLVLAGAGTGKTRVLISRMAHIIVENRAFPSQILAVTFTNKAAKEMVSRLAEAISHPTEGLWIGTFHSIAARILRRHAELVGLNSNFTILDTDDQLRLLKSIILAHNLDEKKYTPKQVLGAIQRWKDQGLEPAKVPSAEANSVMHGRAIQLYKEYQARLTSIGAADFGDLLLHNLTLFMNHPDILAEYHRRFRYLLVDEYQDTNIAQYLWLRLLAQGSKNICCVGDEDQSIYGWRGAEIGNILRFEKDFPGCKVVRLERNYRSTTHILAAASGLISKNNERLGKTLWTEQDGGDKVQILAVWDEREEAGAIANEIEALQRLRKHRLSDMAILVRAGFQTRAFEECFISRAIPYRVIGGLRFYERLEIRDIIAYMRVIAHNDDDLAFERIINTPRRNIGDTTLQALHAYARTHGISLMKAARAMLEEGELKRAKASIEQLITSFDRWKALLEVQHYAEVMDIMLKESGYLAMWQSDKSPEAQGRVENIKELLRALQDFPSMTDFLEHVSLVTEKEGEHNDNMVNIMTLHAAKGLEFRSVFLPGWEEGIFPHSRSLDEEGNAGLEEERRLAYVGITRAKERLTILFAANRRVYNQWQSSISSRFIDELPSEHVEYSNINGMNYRRNAPTHEIPVPKHSTASVIARAAKTLPPAADPVKTAGLQPGDRVFHEKFGYGYIRSISGNHVEVAFDKAGLKKVIDRFLEGFK